MREFQSPYARLMRLHQPVGIWLLLWPCWWSVSLAAHGFPSVWVLLLFAIGAVLMRSAGCIINDMADRDFDRKVERTRSRPLASGELNMQQAFLLLTGLLFAAVVVVVLLGPASIALAALSLVLIGAYPFMKRVTWWPQLFLGFTFNWGALMGWAATHGMIEPPAIALYLGGVFWTLGYDTIYAHQDIRDDTLIGVKSSARRLGNRTKPAVMVFYLLAFLLWALAGWLAGTHIGYYAGLFAALVHFGWQVYSLQLEDPASCRRIFVSNTWVGAVIFLGCIVGWF